MGELFGAVARHAVGETAPIGLPAGAVVLLLENFLENRFDAIFATIREDARPSFAKIAAKAEEMAEELDPDSDMHLHLQRMAISNWATAREGLE